MTTAPATVEQYLLPRQVAAPPGPVDARMMYVMHFAFRRDLQMFADAALATPVEDHDAWEALARRWALFGSNLHHHHAGEDAGLWPLLLEYAAPGERQVLDDMEAEHALIDPILASCATGFDHVLAGDDAARATLARDLAPARDCLAEHLRHEETTAMALVQKYLTQQQWDDMAEEHFGKRQSFRELLATLPWVAHEMPRAELDGLVVQAGRPFGLLLRLTRPRFERVQARATRHLTPAR